jgi:hypothetical protein
LNFISMDINTSEWITYRIPTFGTHTDQTNTCNRLHYVPTLANIYIPSCASYSLAVWAPLAVGLDVRHQEGSRFRTSASFFNGFNYFFDQLLDISSLKIGHVKRHIQAQ